MFIIIVEWKCKLDQKHYSETDYKTQVGCYISTHLYNTVDMWIALDFPSQVEMKAGSLWIKLSLQIATKELILKLGWNTSDNYYLMKNSVELNQTSFKWVSPWELGSAW